MKIKQEKEIRGDILNVLNAAFPAGLTLGYVTNTLLEAGWNIEAEEAEIQCTYLEQKGYIRSDKRGQREFGTKKVIYTITTNGIDVLEGSITDMGVVISG